MNDDNLNGIPTENTDDSLVIPDDVFPDEEDLIPDEIKQESLYATGSDDKKKKEKKDKAKKKKIKKEKNGPKIPAGTIAAILIVSVVVSSISGAASSYFVLSRMKTSSSEKTTDEIEGMAEIDSTPPMSEIPDNNTPLAPGKDTVPSTSTSSTSASKEPLSKSDIYAEAVNSIFAVKAEYNKVYYSILGQTYAPVTSTGTGFAISDSGYIITNYHVIENGEKITVTDYDGNSYPATVVGSEPGNDVAVLKIDAKTNSVSFGSSSALKVGDEIMVIGNALGELSYTFTDGVVSYLNRAVTIETGKTINMFQTNAAINAGNSGGPVYNMNGDVVGIASAKYASDSVEGLGFCIPIDDVDDMILEIILYGYVKNKPSVGLSLQTVTHAMSLRYQIPEGCYVVAVAKNSAGSKAGLKAGDVITELNGVHIKSCEQVEEIMSKLSAGSKITLKYTRGGKSAEVSTILDEYKPSEPRTSYANVHDF